MKAEVPVRLELDYASRKTLARVGKHNVKNSLRVVSKYALEPARDTARQLSQRGIKRGSQDFRSGLSGIGDTYTINKRRKKIRSYRAGVRKKGAYNLSARMQGGSVTLLFGINRDADYYNFVANFWEHGWTANGTPLPGNNFMTRSVRRNLREIVKRYAFAISRAVTLAGATRERRMRASDLRRGGE